MWKLPLPDRVNAIAELRRALTYSNNTPKYPLTAHHEHEIQSIYNQYENANGIACNTLLGENLPKDLLDAIEKGYDEVQSRRRLSDLRSRILLNVRTCPFCGFSQVDELDHYLPKSVFQTLSVYSSNLVPICHNCNKKKSTITGADPQRRFSHAYYSSIPINEQFLFASVSMPIGGLKVELKIRKINDLSEELFDQISYQFEKLELNKRISKEIINDLSSLAFGIKDAYESNGKDNVKRYLKGTASHIRTSFGLNHWRYAIIDALAEYEDFCDGGFYSALAINNSLTTI